MISTADTPRKTTDKAIKSATSIAEYYGFLPIDTIMPDYNTKKRSKLTQHTTYQNSFDNNLASIIRSYIEHGHTRLSEPTLLYNINTNPKNLNKIKFELHILGTQSSIAEATIIKTALSILEDLGISNHRVYVNSIGDKDSTTRFTKEITDYLRKNMNDMPSCSRQLMKKDVFIAYDQLLKTQHDLCSSAPNTIDFLTEASRSHLQEVLEYLEITKVDYELDPSIIGNNDCYSNTLFEIRSVLKDKEEQFIVLARGGRYDELSMRAFRKHVPATSIVFEYEKNGKILKASKVTKSKKPKFYFVQLGTEARIRSFTVIEMLRKAKLPIYQSLGRDQLSAQLELADELAIPYCIIMGHKEALEGNVIVRKIDTRAQNIVPLDELEGHLKAI